MIASDPKRSRTSSTAASSAPARRRSEGRSSWSASVFSRFCSETPSSVIPFGVDQRQRRHEQLARGPEDRVGVGGRLGQRLRARGARVVVEAQAQHHGPADAAGAAQPAGDAVDQPDEQRVQARQVARAAAAERPLGADRPPAHPRPHAPRVAVVGERVEVPARALAEHRDEVVLVQPRDVADRPQALGAQLARRDVARRPRAARPAAGAGTRSRRRAARAAARPASRPRSPPSRGTWSTRPRR